MGHFFDARGRVLETMLSARTLSGDLDGPKQSRLVVIAGGAEKVPAIRAVLNSGRLNGLITDERTAEALLAPEDRAGARQTIAGDKA
jgi:DNA-binding transcriptional regulator LsrR (DeoR family)